MRASDSIDTILKEKRRFDPAPQFQRQANLSDPAFYERWIAEGEKDPVHFWEQQAKALHWVEPWKKACEWHPPFAKWFVGGKINASDNCLDRHLAKHRDKIALIWEGEDGEIIRWSYGELHRQVCRLANTFEKKLGLRAGDTAALYLPLHPQAIVAMLACARVGITHSVIFAGFASHAIRDRVQDAECKVVLTCDVGYRRGKPMPLRETVAAAVKECPTVKHVLVWKRQPQTALSGLERDWEEWVRNESADHQAAPLDSEHPLFILYTSGTTGKPKGIVHSTGGYLLGASFSSRLVFDLKDNDVFWCTADIGWITGHSYLVYGPLSQGATILTYEGALNYPNVERIWEMIDRHQVTTLYTAPTAIRALMRAGEAPLKPYSLKSLRLLGSVGEPINPEAWIWYHENVGKGRCPIVDTWWQTETGSILISPVPGVVSTKPGSATRPLPGIVADIVNEKGESCQANEGGYLVIRHPWPSMLRTIHKDPNRMKETYFSRFPGLYFTGDGAHRDEDGYYWIKGRVDDVINVSGHRLGTMEIESALVSHGSLAEAAVVGRPDDLKGQAIVAFVIPKAGTPLDQLAALETELKNHVVQEIGAIARPEEIRFTKSLPKTRSGKIMRRLLKDLAEGKTSGGDTSTLENAELVEIIEKK